MVASKAQEVDPSLPPVRALIEAYQEDASALRRFHPWRMSMARHQRMGTLIEQFSHRLNGIRFAPLSQEERIDYLLFQNQLKFDERRLTQERQRHAEIQPWIRFGDGILALAEARQRVEPIDPESAAVGLHALAGEIRSTLDELEQEASSKPTAILAVRIADWTEVYRRALEDWFAFYEGYHPAFSWWTQAPQEQVIQELKTFASEVRKQFAGYQEGEDPPVIGDPIGRQALMEALEYEMVAYTPEALLEIARMEFDWCRKERLRASRELGFGEDWRAAYDHVKSKYVPPGEQPQLIKTLAQEAIDFLEDRSLLTIPPLAKEVWRMQMMSAERQKVNPYFTGGEVISVSYPTEEMAHEDKLMSMRGNNVHFARATVHHELIPGHHLQLFMADRYRTHRQLFRTPFLVEGWALYWEMLLWDLGFQRSAEDRLGMLFWRSHRCARILFSLSFHLGEMSADEAIAFLVEEVGHEPRNATAEVRRSVQGGYIPLYQAAYMLGGLQLRALREELVDTGHMSDRAFHDAILKENAIPIDLIRASLMSTDLKPDYKPQWRFYRALEEQEEPGKSGDPQAQVPHATPQDRDGLRLSDRFRGKVIDNTVDPHWFDDGNQFWYRKKMGDGRVSFQKVHAIEGIQAPAMDHALLAACFTAFSGVSVDPYRLPVEALEGMDDEDGVIRLIGPDRDWLWVPLQGRLTACASAPVTEKSAPDAAPGGRRRSNQRDPVDRGLKSPDGSQRLWVKDHNLWLEDLETRQQRALSFDGNPGASFQPNAARDRYVGMQYEREEPAQGVPQAYWSPDGQWVVAMCYEPGIEREVHLVESSPKDQLQPKWHQYPYLKPGDRIPIQKPRLFHVTSGKELALDDRLFSNPWSITRMRWDSSSERFTFLYNQRGHQVLRVVAVSVPDGTVSALIDEQSATFIDYAYKHAYYYMEERGEILWMSERDGWNHLYLMDAQTGQLKRQLTQGEWVVRRIREVNEAKGHVWFEASGLDAYQDPYYIHHCRIDLDGDRWVRLTSSDGDHEITFSPDGRFLLDRWSRVDQAPVVELRRAEEGALVMELERAALEGLLETGWQIPERFVAKGRDGVTDIHGVIYKPTDFDPDRSYPVIEKIYAGPHGSFVPKAFRPYHSAQSMAEHGFIVVQIDGMGTSNRSKAFHDVCWKNIGDAGFPDRIAWMREAARTRPYMDLNRVGIYGGSAGGQNTLRGLLAHGDFYKVGVADCGCHDNRMDKIWWNELWMGWPLGPHYEEQSNVTQAHRLEGDLLLIVGELDRNVDPASTLQVVDALIKADKPFDMLVMPGVGHGAAGTPYGQKRMTSFFVEHLLEP